MHDFKQEVIKNLKILDAFSKKTGQQWKTRSYSKAIAMLNSIPEPLTKNTTKKDLMAISGIGDRISSKILELIDTGEMKAVGKAQEELSKKKTNKEGSIENFKEVYGIGPKTAELLYNKGARKVDKLSKYRHLLNDKQLLGLKYHKKTQKRIQREFITAFKYVVKIILDKNFGKGNYRMMVAGSYRRKHPDSGDIDILFTSKKVKLQQIIKVLEDENIIIAQFKGNENKFEGLAHCPSDDQRYFRLDMRFITEKSWPTALLYFTGSKGFNIAMRETAKKQGYHLDEYGLTKNGRKVGIKSEKDVFDKLGMVYLKPEHRGG